MIAYAKEILQLENECDRLKAELEKWKADADVYRKQFNVAQMKVADYRTALATARVALSLAAGISAVRSDKKLDHQIKEAKEASVSAIEQIDAAGLPEKLG